MHIPNHYTPRSFSFPQLQGISEATMKTHLGLYEGYVKHFNLLSESIAQYDASSNTSPFVINELNRRRSFELNGIKNHELFFEQLVQGSVPFSPDSELARALERQWGSIDAGKEVIALHAGTRGIGWVVMSFDNASDQLIVTWVDEQHLGQLISLSPILVIDLWEHAYLLDYAPSDKKSYVEAIMNNLDWSVCERRFEHVRKAIQS